MNQISLQFRYSPHPQRPACAHFIRGGEPAGWLDELTAWNVPLAALRLYPVPRSRSDNSCIGVLVAFPGSEASGIGTSFQMPIAARLSNPPCPPFVRDGALAPTGGPLSIGRHQAYGRVANRLYLPVEAAVVPELNASEWRELLGPGITEYVWHPQSGLIAFDPDEVLTVASLLSPQWPLESAEDSPSEWNAARTGTIFPNRIVSLRAELPASAEDMLATSRGDIGTQAKNFSQLQGTFSDTVKGVGQTALGLALLPFSFLSGLLSRMLAGMTRRDSPAVSRQQQGLLPGIPPSDLAAGIGGVILVGGLLYLMSHGAAASILPLLVGLGCIMVFAAIARMFGANAGPGAGRSGGQRPMAPGAAAASGGMLHSGGFGAGLQKQLRNLMLWTSGLLDARRREMNRLMKLLKDDPDEGLKYALPMGGEAGRGIAPPTGWLMSRLVDFQLGGIGSGGPADIWDLPPDTQLQLITRYRELAAREVQLGRYRRAAYIFAELLGDLNSAATTLISGRFYREAAVLYRDKLKRPLDAARCLEQGGLLLEAIPLYRQQGQIETVGDLYRRLEEHDEADAAYRDAVEKALGKYDYLDAARLLQDKLDLPHEALATLDAGWPHTQQARRCLDASFSLLTKLGRHEETILRIRKLREAPLPSHRVTDAVEILAATAVGSPFASARLIAADTVRVMAARELATNAANRHQLTAAIGRLAPEDKLLSRDCTRAAEKQPWERQRSTAAKSVSHPKTSTSGLRLVKTFQLPVGVTWTSACETDRNFYVVGRRGNEVVVALGAWNDPSATVSSVSWNRFHGEMSNFLICHSTSDRTLFMGSTGPWRFEPREFRATDANPDWEVAVTPAWMPKSISGIAASPSGTVFTFQLMELLLTGFTNQRHPTICETLPIPILNRTLDPNATYPMVARDDAVYLAVGKHLVESTSGKAAVLRDLSSPITGLSVSPHGTERRLAVVFDEGGMLFWDKLSANRNHRFGIGLSDPRAVILRSSHLVAHGRGGWRIYSTTDDKIQQQKELPCEVECEVFGLLRPGAARQVALCTSDGHVRVYELP